MPEWRATSFSDRKIDVKFRIESNTDLFREGKFEFDYLCVFLNINGVKSFGS